MAVPVPLEPEEPVDWVLVTEQAADDLYEISTRLGTVMWYSEVARAQLAEAADLLDADTDFAEILVADMFALTLAVADGDLLDEASVDAMAKLIASVFSGVPALPGATSAARDLVSSVFSLSQMAVGPLQDALIDMKLAIDCHENASFTFFICTSQLLVQPHVSSGWCGWKKFATHQEVQAKLFLEEAIEDAKDAAESIHRLCLATSLEQRREHMTEAKQILDTAIKDIDDTLGALMKTRNAINFEELLVRQAIHYAPAL